MMLRQIAFWALCSIHHVRAEPLIHYVRAESLTVHWGLRSNGGNFKANTQDSVMLDWTSDASSPFLSMLCRNETVGGDAVLVSSFGVNTNGPFEYILDSYVETGTMNFPRLCFPELAVDAQHSNGVESQIGIDWSLDQSVPVKTVSQASDVPPTETRTAASRSSTTTPNGSSTHVTTSPPSQTTTNPTPGANQPNPPSTGGPASDAAATTGPAASTPSSTSTTSVNNTATKNAGANYTGVIVGGVIGGIAVLSFIIFGFFFLRRQRRNSAFSLATKESSKWRASFFKRESKGPTPVFEKDGNGLVRELEANEMAHEIEGNGMERELEANAGNLKANRTEPYYSVPYGSRSPVELLASSNYYS